MNGCKLKYAFDEKNKNVVIGQDSSPPQQDINAMWAAKIKKSTLFLPKQYESQFGRNNRLTNSERNNLLRMQRIQENDKMWKNHGIN